MSPLSGQVSTDWLISLFALCGPTYWHWMAWYIWSQPQCRLSQARWVPTGWYLYSHCAGQHTDTEWPDTSDRSPNVASLRPGEYRLADISIRIVRANILTLNGLIHLIAAPMSPLSGQVSTDWLISLFALCGPTYWHWMAWYIWSQPQCRLSQARWVPTGWYLYLCRQEGINLWRLILASPLYFGFIRLFLIYLSSAHYEVADYSFSWNLIFVKFPNIITTCIYRVLNCIITSH